MIEWKCDDVKAAQCHSRLLQLQVLRKQFIAIASLANTVFKQIKPSENRPSIFAYFMDSSIIVFQVHLRIYLCMYVHIG
jgi:hypothetical protein